MSNSTVTLNAVVEALAANGQVYFYDTNPHSEYCELNDSGGRGRVISYDDCGFEVRMANSVVEYYEFDDSFEIEIDSGFGRVIRGELSDFPEDEDEEDMRYIDVDYFNR